MNKYLKGILRDILGLLAFFIYVFFIAFMYHFYKRFLGIWCYIPVGIVVLYFIFYLRNIASFLNKLFFGKKGDK